VAAPAGAVASVVGASFASATGAFGVAAVLAAGKAEVPPNGLNGSAGVCCFLLNSPTLISFSN
jgi:hypothetical protein